MQNSFQTGEAQKEFIAKLQAALRDSTTTAGHIHVHGEAGIGKTRLVLEATRAPDLASLVLYAGSPAEILQGDLMNALLQEDNNLTVLLVADETNREARTRIWDKLKFRGPRIRLVTIYNEWETSSEIPVLNAPLLAREEIARIIESYNIPMDQAERWAELCSGSPRVAHVIGLNLRNNPEDLLKPPETVNIWHRYVFAGDDPNSAAAQDRLIVLRYVALFKRFGFEEPVMAEAMAIAKLIQTGFPQITWPKFQTVITELKQRRILQGETTLYVTPKALIGGTAIGRAFSTTISGTGASRISRRFSWTGARPLEPTRAAFSQRICALHPLLFES